MEQVNRLKKKLNKLFIEELLITIIFNKLLDKYIN